MSIYARLKPKGKNGFGYGSTAEEVTAGLSLVGKTFVITGCNSGLGLETARVLALRGGRVFGLARTEKKAKEALSSFGESARGFSCELSDSASVRNCIQAVQIALDGSKIDAIIGNAAIMALPKCTQILGIEAQFFTNHLGHFQLITGLVDQLAEQGRVVMVSSTAHRRAPEGGIEFDNLSGTRNYKPWKAYGQSKMANLLFAKELARRFEGTKRIANAVHPGVIRTRLARHMSLFVRFLYSFGEVLMLKNVQQGAATLCYAAVHPGVTGFSGQYYADCNLSSPRKAGSDMATAKKLWEVSENILAGLK